MAPNIDTPAVRITCKVRSRRRGGKRHSKGTEDYPPNAFTEDQLDQIKGDSAFKVEELTDPPKTDPPKTDPPKTDPPKTDPPKESKLQADGLNLTESAKAINACETIEALDALILGDDRKGVAEAAFYRREELLAASK